MQDNTKTVVVLLIANVLSLLLPKIGVDLGNDVVTTVAQAVVTIGSSIWVYLSHKKVITAGRAVGAVR